MSDESKKPKVNQNTCIGCGICVSIAPHVFQMNDAGKSNVVDESAPGAESAVSACPVGAITLE